MTRKTLPAVFYSIILAVILSIVIAPGVLAAKAGSPPAPTAPGHSINFQAVGLPAGVPFTITGTRVNNGGHPSTYTTSFTTPNLSAVLSADPGSEFTYSGFTTTLTVGGQYYTLISTLPSSPFTVGASGGSTTVVATYQVTCNPPAIILDPVSQTVQYGDEVTFMVTATGSTPLTYEWYKDNTLIGGADQATYSLPFTMMGDAGMYHAVVSNTCGTDSSTQAQLSVNKADQTIDFPAPASTAMYGTSFTVAATASSGLEVSFGVTGMCELVGNTVTMTSGTGVCTITASQAGDDNYNPATDEVHTVLATKADQTIDFPAPASPVAPGASFNLSATATSGLEVSFGVSGVCELVGNTVTMTSGTGVCTITASQAGDDNYNPAADVAHTVDAAKANQTIDFPAPASSATYGTSFTVSATATSGLDVSFGVSGVCDLVGNSVTMNSGTGVCTITASQAGDDNYGPAPDVVHTVDAAKADQTIDFPAPASPAVYGTSFTVSGTATSGLGVSFQATGVCMLAGTTVTLTSGTGVCTVTASQAGDDNYNPAPDVVHTVQAAKADQTINFPAPATPAVYGTSFTVSGAASSGLEVSFQATGVCTLAGSTVTMTSGTGSCTVTASQAGDDNYNPALDVIHTVQAAKANQTVNFPAPASPAVYGTSFMVSGTATSGLGVSFQATGVCTLAGTTVTMTSGTGTCAVTASQAGDDNYNPAPDVVHTLQATKADQTINFPSPASPAVYGTSFTVSGTATSGLGVSFQATGVCTLAGTTVTMTSGISTCTVTASQAGDDNYNPAPDAMHTVQAAKANQSIDFTAPSSPIAFGTTFDLYATSSSELVVSFEAQGVCTLIENTVAMTSGTGTCTLTASQVGDDNYNPAEDVSYEVQATRADQSIDFPQPASPVKYQTSFVVSPTATSGLPVILSASGSCTNNGYTVTMTQTSGVCWLVASQAGNFNYLPAAEVQRSVEPAPNGNKIYIPLLFGAGS